MTATGGIEFGTVCIDCGQPSAPAHCAPCIAEDERRRVARDELLSWKLGSSSARSFR